MIRYRGKAIATLDDVDLEGRRVLVRVDLNSPIDPATGRIMEHTRILQHALTVKELLALGCGVAVISHQGRPLSREFTSMEEHAELLSKFLGASVEFVPDIIGPEAKRRLGELGGGEVLLLDNSRLLSEDYVEAPPERHANSITVSRLYPHFDYFIYDAFATAHRSQATTVGFQLRLPSVAGRIVEREIRSLTRVLEGGERPKAFVIGGSKVSDALDVINYLAEGGVADEILTAGLVGVLFNLAQGGKTPGGAGEGLLGGRVGELVERARRIMARHGFVRAPIDYWVDQGGSVRLAPASRITGAPVDIGPSTIEYYSYKLAKAKVIVFRGPAGKVEDPRFRGGTLKLLREALREGSFTILGGGHLSLVLPELPPEARRMVGHHSTGGGALLHYLAGKPLPALESLAISASRFGLGG